MNKKEIDSIVYLINQAEANKSPKPIVFIGAGASVTAGIPTADDIVNSILTDYAGKPEIQKMREDEKTYPNIMSKLNASERNEILRKYINKAKINATHIYLAQLLHDKFIDYVLTVNFDNLLLRASALFNYLPPVYDIANLDNLTTTTIPNGSVTYLHGQHTGLWLLNTQDEMAKINRHVTAFLNKICNGRTWIIVGYSGEDKLFDEIIKLGRFDNELFWVGYKDVMPITKVQEAFDGSPNLDASLIQGYDSDNFFMTLNRKLGCKTPTIFTKPFSFLKNIIDDVIIKEDSESFLLQDDYQQELKSDFLVQKILDQTKNQLKDAIIRYEIDEAKQEVSTRETEYKTEIIELSKLRQRLLEITINADFEKEKTFIQNVKNIPELQNELAILNMEWANHLSEEAERTLNMFLFNESIKKYEIAESLNPNVKSIIYNNWGVVLNKMYKITGDESLYTNALEKYKESCLLNSKESSSWYNWGNALIEKALLLSNPELFHEAIEKYQKSFENNPNNDFALCNWGNCLSNLYKITKDESFLIKSMEKFEQAFGINPYNEIASENWGINLAMLAKARKDPKLFMSAFDKYKIALKINPNNHTTYNNLAGSIIEYYKITKDESCLEDALTSALKASKGNSSRYNLACIYALLENQKEALRNLETSLHSNDINVTKVLEDEEWNDFKNDSDFLSIINKYSQK